MQKDPKHQLHVGSPRTFFGYFTGGSFTNGLPFSLSMGCGTWQKNTIDNNLNYKHFLNITKIANLIPGKEAKLSDYFKDYCENNDPKELKSRLWNQCLLSKSCTSK